MSKNSKTVVEKPAAKKAAAAKATKTAAKKVEAKSAAKATTKKAEVKEVPAKKAAPKAEKAVKAAKAATKEVKAPAKETVKEAPKAKAAKAVKAPAKKSSTKAAPKAVEVEFIADCPLATTVSVAGSFNDWAVDKDMLKKDKKTGLWTAKVSLVPGDYEYKFVCDGQYWDEGENKVKHV